MVEKKEKSNGAANYDENTGTVGFGFVDACVSEYSKKKGEKIMCLVRKFKSVVE